MRSELSDSHLHRLAGVSYQHVLVPRDDLEYLICSSIHCKVGRVKLIFRVLEETPCPCGAPPKMKMAISRGVTPELLCAKVRDDS